LAIGYELAGGAVGRDSAHPAAAMATEWRNPAEGVGSPADPGWWQLFPDPVPQD